MKYIPSQNVRLQSLWKTPLTSIDPLTGWKTLFVKYNPFEIETLEA